MKHTEVLEKLQAFIKAHRSNEIHFEALNHKLEDTYSWASKPDGNKHLSEELNEIREKQAKAYKVSRENTSSDWPQFEQFVQAFERSVVSAIKEG
jgi:hypothetical protein